MRRLIVLCTVFALVLSVSTASAAGNAMARKANAYDYESGATYDPVTGEQIKAPQKYCGPAYYAAVEANRDALERANEFADRQTSAAERNRNDKLTRARRLQDGELRKAEKQKRNKKQNIQNINDRYGQIRQGIRQDYVDKTQEIQNERERDIAQANQEFFNARDAAKVPPPCDCIRMKIAIDEATNALTEQQERLNTQWEDLTLQEKRLTLERGKIQNPNVKRAGRAKKDAERRLLDIEGNLDTVRAKIWDTTKDIDGIDQALKELKAEKEALPNPCPPPTPPSDTTPPPSDVPPTTGPPDSTGPGRTVGMIEKTNALTTVTKYDGVLVSAINAMNQGILTALNELSNTQTTAIANLTTALTAAQQQELLPDRQSATTAAITALTSSLNAATKKIQDARRLGINDALGTRNNAWNTVTNELK